MPEGLLSLPPLVALEDVRVDCAGTTPIDGLTMALRPAGITAIMGPNGAGKSLTLRLIAGLIAPSAGHVRLAQPAPRCALVAQDPVLLRRSVRANLRHAMRVMGMPRRERAARLQELLAIGGLTGLAERPARRLSGGERQRLAIVRALAARPGLLLLDEPTASLDPAATAAVEALIRGAAAAGAKVVLVTHDRGQARRLANDVVFLHRGQVREQTPIQQFLGSPASAEARAYLSGNLLV